MGRRELITVIATRCTHRIADVLRIDRGIVLDRISQERACVVHEQEIEASDRNAEGNRAHRC